MAKSGSAVALNQPVLRLDTLDLEQELAGYECELDSAAIAAERLEDDYVDRFVACISKASKGCPAESLSSVLQSEWNFADTLKSYVAKYVSFNLMSSSDLALIESEVDKLLAAKAAADDERMRMRTDIKAQRTINEATRSELKSKIDITKHQIDLCTLLAPKAGRLTMHVYSEAFVEKGDLLLEVS